MNYRDKFRAEQARGNTLSGRVFDVQQECVRIGFESHAQDRLAQWVAETLAAALAEFEGVNK